MTSQRFVLGLVLTLAAAMAVAVYAYAGGPGSTPLLAGLFNILVSERGTSVTRGVVYGPGNRQKLDIYHPARPPETGRPRPPDDSPIAIFLYGGSWQKGERSYYEFVGRALSKKGVTAVIPDYRLYPEVKFPAFMDDAADAYAFVARTMALRVNGKPRPIVLIGHSAGAHMAALLALDKSYLEARGADIPPPSALIGLAGPYAFDPTTWPSTKAVFAGVTDPDVARPVVFAKNGGPPVLLMHGLDDDTTKISNMRDLAKALKASGTNVQTLELAKIGHLSILTSIAKPLRGWAPVLQAMREFMIRHANLPPPAASKPSKPVPPPVLPPQ
ncbi:MAG: alpha/beta hydrolase [Hyphomicrobium sp.]